MSVERLEFPDDGRLDAYRDLRDGDLLRRRGLFVAEGRLVLRRVIDDGRFHIQSVLVNEAALADLAGPIASLDDSVPVFVCPTASFLRLTGFNLHRGCLALVRRPAPTPIESLVAQPRLLLVLENVSNPDNVGGIFRNAAAFGAGGVLLSPASCDPLYRKAIRTSMAAVLHVPFTHCDRGAWRSAPASMREAGFTIAALTPRASGETLDAFARRWRGSEASGARRLALVVGAEGAGLSAETEAYADARVSIETTDRVDSLNVAVAAGIALYAVR
jgi:tRNA G18 (ribose-2'-O)-methylase SpoU